MSAWQILFLLSTVVAGGSLGFFFRLVRKDLIKLLLSFSGAYILGIAVLHLLPWVFTGGGHRTGIWILLGFFIQLLLEQFSAGVEHGHIHAPHRFSAGFVFSVMAGLCIHAFVEGMPLSYYDQFHEAELGHSHSHNHLLYGIVLHHIPAAFALVTLLLAAGLSRPWTWCCLLVFAAMSPLGAGLADLVSIDRNWQRAILAFAVGSLLHIATVIIFETDAPGHHAISPGRLLAIVAGFGISLLTLA